ncbi:hypothetical protein [Microvirga yunnanensis]|uniref:hypothetical protein n=1 Tax=Microvirga yunnanensis TaxID=2953740 RepID=UPI0021C8E7BE|nr:hypothetical protein [Microvirga sp. HBU65207]
MLDQQLLKQALDELVILKSCVHGPSRFLGRLYASALEEWADQLSIDPPKLDKLVVTKEAASIQHHH